MLSANETLDYQGPREAKDIKQWAEDIAKETFTVIEKENLKADVRERKLDAYFVLYSPESSFAEMEKAFKRYDGFFYYINSNESKLVAQQSGYQFTLKDLSNPQMISAFVLQHAMPFVSRLSKKNLEELSTKPGKYLAIIAANEHEDDIRQLIEYQRVNNPKDLASFNQFVFATANETNEIVKKVYRTNEIESGEYVIVYNGRNEKKVKYSLLEINGDSDIQEQLKAFLDNFDPMQMVLISEKVIDTKDEI